MITSDWRIFRYEYYSASRYLLMSGYLRPGTILASYATEYSLKELIVSCDDEAIISEYIHEKGLKNSHNVLALYKYCINKKLLPSDLVSIDLLDYLCINFNRYPSEVQNSFIKAKEHSINNYQSIDYIPIFDNLIVILDDMIVERKGKIEGSIIFKALNEFDTYESRVIFHQNYYSFSRIDKYLQVFKELIPIRYNQYLGFIEKNDLLIFEDNRLLMMQEEVDWNLIKNYKHDKVKN